MKLRKIGLFTVYSVGLVGVGVYLERNRFSSSRINDVSICEAASLDSSFLSSMEDAVGRDNVLVGSASKEFLTGTRVGQGKAVCVVKPCSLQDAVKAVQVCVDHDMAIIPQGGNTGLTGGSVPRDDAGRQFVVLNMRSLNKIQMLGNGDHVLCYGGAGIYDLSQECAKAGRESHTVLGSYFLNPSVAAGVALGSGGTQLKKGSVYSERLLYVRVGKNGKVELVNELGLKLKKGESVLERLEKGEVELDDALNKKTHDTKYCEKICQLDGSVSRYNADTNGPDAVRSEGKVLILCSIHSTFPKPVRSTTLWVSCASFETAQTLRKVCLRDSTSLPSQMEYLNRDAFDVTDGYGRVMCFLIKKVRMAFHFSKN